MMRDGEMAQESPAQAEVETPNSMSEHPANFVNSGGPGGPSELDAARQFLEQLGREHDVEQRRRYGESPRLDRGWRRFRGPLAGRARAGLRAVAGRVVPKRRRARRGRALMEAGLKRPAV